ncbi:heme NO-binding domain-containing protein [Cognatishimia activa]|uniref:heme NO-binding domain-containing protein n=1 Tax=Cognatishimia activa TaxID=1715691 RepID=UPI00222E79EA|nr:heme NO-binding domain-containing protein [Cognatishimia activa]UZD91554.1 heme NO-binding domain-containing protein [Cognatishimia activa]
MHGLINRAIQCFVRDTYGANRWIAVTRRAQLDFTEFEAMLHYEDKVTEDLVTAISAEMSLPKRVVLEDIGTYLASHENVEAVRRLLRFSGATFLEFLHSLDDLQARARLALADLDMPKLELHDHGENQFSLQCLHEMGGFSYVVMGVLRTMADDYGALVLLEHAESRPDREIIHIQLVEQAYSAGRQFNLGAKTA